MQKQFLNKDTLKQFISDNRLNEVVKNLIFQLNEFLDKNKNDIDYEPIRKLSDALIINSGKLNGVEHDKIIGIIDYDTQKITTSEVQNAVLYIIDQLPIQFWNYRNENQALSYKSKLIESVEILQQTQNQYKYDIFICFSTKDREIAKPIWETIRGYGFRVFVSDEDLQNSVGFNYLDKIDFALDNSQHLILLSSDNAINSVHVRDEYQAFYNDFHAKNPKNRLLIVYKLDDFSIDKLPRILKTKQIANNSEQIVLTLVQENLTNHENLLKQQIESQNKKAEYKIIKENIELQSIKEMDFGNILYKIPDLMRLNKTERCEIRIAKKDFSLVKLSQGLASEIVKIDNLKISDEMEVKLVSSQNDAFNITSITRQEQFIENDSFTEWKFDVTPLKTGNHLLSLVVSVVTRNKYNKEIKKDIVFEKSINVGATLQQSKDIQFENIDLMNIVGNENISLQNLSNSIITININKPNANNEVCLTDKKQSELKQEQERIAKEQAELKYKQEQEQIAKEQAELNRKQEQERIAKEQTEIKKSQLDLVKFQKVDIKYDLMQFVDYRDDNSYKIIKIGNQIWFAENLRFKANEGCFPYDEDKDNIKKFGYLYSWDTAKKIIPEGWHIPSKEEWNELFENIKLDFEQFRQIFIGKYYSGKYEMLSEYSELWKKSYFWCSDKPRNMFSSQLSLIISTSNNFFDYSESPLKCSIRCIKN